MADPSISNGHDNQEQGRLDSWKQIAAYLGKSERTVRRWQQTEGLPVYRHQHQQKGSVWSYRRDVDAWLAERKQSPAQDAASAVAAQVPPRHRRWIRAAASIAAVGLAFFGIAAVLREEPAMLNPIPLAHLPGSSYGVDFSPDLSQVVFYWAPAMAAPQGIYLKKLDGDPVPLDTGEVPTSEARSYLYSPAWSPDGKTIAYLRRRIESTASEVVTDMCMVSPGGGATHQTCPIRLAEGTRFWGDQRHLGWTSDSKWVIAPFDFKDRKGIYAVSPVTGEARLLSEHSSQLQSPALSPDQKKLVYARLLGIGGTSPEEIVRQDLTADLRPEGAAKVLLTQRSRTQGIAWDPSGRELILCASASGYAGDRDYHMYRMAAEPGAARKIMLTGNCATVTVARSNDRKESILAYASDNRMTAQLLKLPLRSNAAPVPFVHSGRMDSMPVHSPDGKFIAFLSNRSGPTDIWIASRAGTNLRKLTNESNVVFLPKWSPDGRRLVYASSTPSAKLELFIVSIDDDGPPTKVRVPDEDAVNPVWSDDGAWIFYWAGTSFWKVHPDGSDRQEVFRYSPGEYRLRPHYQDGYIYSLKFESGYSVRRLHVTSRKEETLNISFISPNYALTKSYFYFFRAHVHSRVLYRHPLSRIEDAGSAEIVGTVPTVENVPQILAGISVAPDDSEVILSKPSGQTLEMQYVRGFR